MLHPFLSTRKSNLEGKIEIASAHWSLLNSFSRSKTDITSLQLQRLWSRADTGQMVREKYKFCAFMQRISSRGNVWRTVGRRRWRPESKNPPGSTSLAAQNQVSYLDFWNDCWCLSDAAAVDLLEGQQDYWSYDNNRYTVLQCNVYPAPTILHPFGSNLVVPFTFLISLCLTWHCPQSDRVTYWFTLPLSCLASISCKRQSSREHGVMLAHSALLPYLFLLLPFLPTSLQRSRSWAQIRIWGRMFSCFTMPDKCVFCLKWGLGLWPIFSFKFNHIASRLNFSCCKNCRFGKWWR